MARTPSSNENHRPHRRLLIYGLGFVLLTNVLTVVFVFLLRGPRQTSIAVVPAATPAAGKPAQAAVSPAATTRQVHVTSRPSGAVVRYRGDVQGTTPLTVALPAGAASVLNLEKDGYRARSVTVKPGETRVRVRLYHTPAASAESTGSSASPAAARTPAVAPATPAAAPGTQSAPATAPRTAPATAPRAAPATAPRAAPATAPRAAPEPPIKAPSGTAASGATSPAAAANDTRPPAARTAQPKPARRPAAENPEPRQGTERPAAGASRTPDPRDQ